MARGAGLAAGARQPASFYLGAGGALAEAPARRATTSHGPADFAAGSGTQTRYERIAGIDTRDYYADWAARERELLGFTSAPLTQPLRDRGPCRA